VIKTTLIIGAALIAANEQNFDRLEAELARMP
jgi:hypothetical protein